jgi:hypothetical protein
MTRLWQSLNRDLIPRRFTAVGVGILFGFFAVTDAYAGRWVLAAINALAAAVALAEGVIGFSSRRSHRRYNDRRAAGLCGRCGYDLRGSLSVRCTECGAYHGSTPGKRLPRGSMAGKDA